MPRVPAPKSLCSIVPRPRAEDAVGAALRAAYVRDAAMPEDLTGLIAQLMLIQPERPAR